MLFVLNVTELVVVKCFLILKNVSNGLNLLEWNIVFTELLFEFSEGELLACLMHCSYNINVLTVVSQNLKAFVLRIGVPYLVHFKSLENELMILVVVTEAHKEPNAIGRNIRVVGWAFCFHAVLWIVATLLLSDKSRSHTPSTYVVQRTSYLVALTSAKSTSISAKNTCCQSTTGVPVTKCDWRVTWLIVSICLRNCAYKTRTCSKCSSVKALSILHWAVLAVTTVLSPYQTRELLMQGLIVKTKTLKSARTKRGQEDICSFKQLIHYFQAFWVLSINCSPFLVERTAVISDVVEFGTESHTPSHTLGTLFVASEWLYLNYGCTHFSKSTACCRSCCILSKFDNLYSFKSCHIYLLT